SIWACRRKCGGAFPARHRRGAITATTSKRNTRPSACADDAPAIRHSAVIPRPAFFGRGTCSASFRGRLSSAEEPALLRVSQQQVPGSACMVLSCALRWILRDRRGGGTSLCIRHG